MDEITVIDNNYKDWIKNVSSIYKNSQIKAAIKVNTEMIMFYWFLGYKMDGLKSTVSWGKHFYEQISTDLKKELPDVKSFSPRNLLYMHQFYKAVSDEEITQQLVSQIENNEITQQLVSQLIPKENLSIFMIPWGHIVLLLNKFQNDKNQLYFYSRKTVESNWSRAVLMNVIESDLYSREGKAITNFHLTLPKKQGDLAQALTRDPYNFNFLTLDKDYDEKQLKDALMDNAEKFFLELGNGFAYLGREVRIDMGDTDNFIDMLFYNVKIHCYIVVEVKVGDFEPKDMGQLGTYMVAVNHQMKTEFDNPTLGLIICKNKDDVKAQYALEATSQPMGISAYDVNQFMPENFKGALPSIEEIEAELKAITDK